MWLKISVGFENNFGNVGHDVAKRERQSIEQNTAVCNIRTNQQAPLLENFYNVSPFCYVNSKCEVLFMLF